MAYTIQIKPKARKNLDNLPENYRDRIVAAMDGIVSDPFSGKKLSGKHKGEYSVRVWPYRIIYRIEKQELIIIVIDVGHRKEIY